MIYKYEIIGTINTGRAEYNYSEPRIKGKLKYKRILIKKLIDN
jgi:hypothetical protein